ncbi:MAG: cation:proton antiporter [Bdellovibrionota bacterium]|nr:MAG: cation:proton antiporter [Bdellovibrionota bacterium]
MELSLLRELVVTLALALVVLLVCHRLRIPGLVGLLATGVLAGPHLLGITNSSHEIELLAEIGVVLLLFTIGLEFSLGGLAKIRRFIVIGGGVQLALTWGVAYAVLTLLWHDWREAVIFGFLVAFSSTAIVLKILQERGLVDAPAGRVALSILILQDIAVVFVMMLIPLLSGSADSDPSWSRQLLSFGAVLVSLPILYWIVPRALYVVARTGNPELFLLSVLVLGFLIAFIFQSVGLSLALGAFLAGLIIAESEFSHQALGNMLPLQQVFTSFFFVSIGMLLDVPFLLAHWPLIAGATTAVIIGKALIVIPAVLLLGLPLRIGLTCGLFLAQVGEFSFVLARNALDAQILTEELYQIFLAVSLVSMALTPLLMSAAEPIVALCYKLSIPLWLKEGRFFQPEHREPVCFVDHLIIVGYGVNGRNIARGAVATHIPHIVLEMNPEMLKQAREDGSRALYGDASQEAVLREAGVAKARMLVIAIADPVATRRITSLARSLHPALHIVARTRLMHEIPELHKLGANEVIPEEFETSIEIFSRALRHYLVPEQEIDALVAKLRAGSYEMFRSPNRRSLTIDDISDSLSELNIASIRVPQESSWVHRSLSELDIRNTTGVTLLAIRRPEGVISNPAAATRINAEDLLLVLGAPHEITKLQEQLNAAGQ